jgi:flagellum-specific peptidoglycan hydrolase FlgJ
MVEGKMNREERLEWLKKVYKAAKSVLMEGRYFGDAGVIAAQAALESAWGQSDLARQANNLFGIKTGKSWKGPWLEMQTLEYDSNGEPYILRQKWRAYSSYEECIRDYLNIINTKPWFASAVEAAKKHDAKGYLYGLLPGENKPGWATDPRYAEKVWRIYETYRLGEWGKSAAYAEV